MAALDVELVVVDLGGQTHSVHGGLLLEYLHDLGLVLVDGLYFAVLADTLASEHLLLNDVLALGEVEQELSLLGLPQLPGLPLLGHRQFALEVGLCLSDLGPGLQLLAHDPVSLNKQVHVECIPLFLVSLLSTQNTSNFLGFLNTPSRFDPLHLFGPLQGPTVFVLEHTDFCHLVLLGLERMRSSE